MNDINFQLYHKLYINKFVDSFLLKKHQDRWRKCLLSGSKEELRKLTTWDFWDKKYVNVHYCQEWESEICKMKNIQYIKDNLNRICLLVKVGHDDCGVENIMLSEIINRECFILEGIIIVDPEKLAIVVSHDGDYCMCKNI